MNHPIPAPNNPPCMRYLAAAMLEAQSLAIAWAVGFSHRTASGALAVHLSPAEGIQFRVRETSGRIALPMPPLWPGGISARYWFRVRET